MIKYSEGDIVNYVTVCKYSGDVTRRVKCRVHEITDTGGSLLYDLDVLDQRVKGGCSLVVGAENLELCLQLVA